jgi:ElaA protein
VIAPIHESTFEDLDTTTLYEILRLRVDVFVVEQECPYPEIDGLDPSARHYWVENDDGLPVAYLRVIDDGSTRRIGRVVTHQEARSQRLANRLMQHVLDSTSGPWVLSAQTYLRRWYAGFGFTEQGVEYLEDGIPHIDMSRSAV